MPTMSKLFAAILVAALGYVAADRVALHLPEEVPPGMLRPVMLVFGIFIGWRFLGRRVGDGYRSAMGLGLSAAVILVLVGLLWFSFFDMIKKAMRLYYGGNPFAALQDMFQIGLELSAHLVYPDVIAVLVLGGILAGVICEAVGRRWS